MCWRWCRAAIRRCFLPLTVGVIVCFPWSWTHCVWKLSEVGAWKGHDGWLRVSGSREEPGKGTDVLPRFRGKGPTPATLGRPPCSLFPYLPWPWWGLPGGTGLGPSRQHCPLGPWELSKGSNLQLRSLFVIISYRIQPQSLLHFKSWEGVLNSEVEREKKKMSSLKIICLHSWWHFYFREIQKRKGRISPELTTISSLECILFLSFR